MECPSNKNAGVTVDVNPMENIRDAVSRLKREHIIDACLMACVGRADLATRNSGAGKSTTLDVPWGLRVGIVFILVSIVSGVCVIRHVR